MVCRLAIFCAVEMPVYERGIVQFWGVYTKGL